MIRLSGSGPRDEGAESVSETVDQLTAKLAQSERTVATLKEALVAREERINELELALARLERGAPTTPATRPHAAASAPSGNPGGPSHPLIVETVGVYPDLWTDMEAMVRFVDAIAGRTLRLSFFVPPVPGEETKELRIMPNFAAATTLALRRGHASQVQFDVPNQLALRPELRIQLDHPEPRFGDDRRRLGVKIGTIGVDPTGDEGDAR